MPIPRTRIGPAILFLGSGVLLLGALGFQYLGDLYPCPLCVYQRYPHGAVLALSLAALVAPGRGPRVVLTLLAALALLATAAIAAFHVGVEQKWWAGLAACEGTSALGGEDLSFDRMRDLAESGPPPRCDEVPWSLFGISMAGYNFIFSVGLAAFGAYWAIGACKGQR